MPASVVAADTAAVIRRRAVHVALTLAVVTFIGTGFWYSSTQPSRMERILGCVDKLGYTAYSYHDDGKEPFDPGLTGLPPGDVQVRPPSNHVVVHIPGGNYEDLKVPDRGAPEVVDLENPTNAAERAVAACAN